MCQLSTSNIIKHLAFIAGIATLLVFVMLYPFLSGGYDQLAMPLSIMVQVFGLVGLPLALVGLLWLILPKYCFVFAIAAAATGTFLRLSLLCSPP